MCFGIRFGTLSSCSRCSEDNMLCDYFRVGGRVFEREHDYTVHECQHEDWKTVCARPDDYPRLRDGDVVTFLGPFYNFYGTFARVRTPFGRIYDINFRCISERC